METLWSILVLLYWILLQHSARPEKTPLRLLSLLPYPPVPGAPVSPSYSAGPSLFPAVDLAVRHVNERRGLLDDYELEAIAGDSGCDFAPTAQFSFVKNVFGRHINEGSVAGIIGPVCPESTLEMAQLSSRPEIALINVHQASSHSLEASSHDYSFSMLSPASHLVETLIAFIVHTGWRRMAVLYEANRVFYRKLFQLFVSEAEMAGLDLDMEFKGIPNTVAIPTTLSTIQNSGYRVVLLFLGEHYTSQVLCCSMEKGLTYPNYQWVLVATSLTDILSRTPTTDSCVFGLDNSLVGVFLVEHYIKLTDEFYEQYSAELNSTGEKDSLYPSVHGALLYDAVWVLALALNNSLNKLGNRGVTLSDYTFGMPETTGIVERELWELEFNGVSGFVSFRETDRFSGRPVRVNQVVTKEGKVKPFAQLSSDSFEVFPTNNESLDMIEDSFPTSSQEIRIEVSVVFFVFILVNLIILVSIHTATLVYRNSDSVRASSNKMNQFNIVGNYLMLTGLFLNDFIKAFNNNLSHEFIGWVCHFMWPWALSIGSTLIVGSLSLKTWRLYRIFVHYLNPGKILSDKALSLFLCLLVGIDVAIAVVWTATDPITARVESEQVTDSDGRITVRQLLMCRSGSVQIWMVLIMLYKMVLLGVLLTLTILTRKIKNKNFMTLNLRIVSYTFTFTVAFGFSLFFFLFFISVHILVDYVVLNVLLHSVVLQNIILVLLPPLLPVIREKLKNNKLLSSFKLVI